jgi:type III secretory pathway component EscU
LNLSLLSVSALNLKTAPLGITFSLTLLGRADELIEWRCCLLRCTRPVVADAVEKGLVIFGEQ